MDEQQKQSGHFVSLADLSYFFRRSKRAMLISGSILALLAILWTLTSPVEYVVTATFKEHSKSPVSTNLVSSILISGLPDDDNASAAMALMNSRRIIGELVKQEGLQAFLDKSGVQFSTLRTIFNNVIVELALYTNKKGLILAQHPNAVIVRNVTYTDEVPSNLAVHFISDENFEIKEKNGNTVLGRIGFPVTTQIASFTIERTGNPSTQMAGEQFVMTLLPLEMSVQNEIKKLTIEADRDDKSLLKLKYRCSDRYRGAVCLNALMALYQDYLRKDQKRILDEQVVYLHMRQSQMKDQLQKMMDAHASVLAADAVNTGFLNSARAMEFLSGRIQAHTQRLMAIDLELQCLHHAQQEGPQSLERWISPEEKSSLNETFVKLRALQQQADSLDLALRQTYKEGPVPLLQFASAIEELEKAQARSEDIKLMLAYLQNGRVPTPSPLLLEDAQYMIKDWCDKLDASRYHPHAWNSCAKNFIAYLSNLGHLFQVQAKTIQERLSNQQSNDSEYPGLDLAAARSLYIDYSRQLDAIEASLNQYRFIIDKMKFPEFEISALTTILQDPISKNIIEEASKEQLGLKDQNNRSAKELERIEYNLSLHKKFLETHLQQSIALQQLNQELLQSKILSLQRVTLSLTHQEISVLDEHLSDFIKRRIEILNQEKVALQKHQRDLQLEVSKWPTQWVSEMLIEQQLDMNKKMVEEITKLVESRNITSNIEVVQSTPVDVATPPLQPKSPRVILFAFLFFIFGALIPLAWNILKSIATGMPVTIENLKLSGFSVAGTLMGSELKNASKPLLDADLQTLRHVVSFLEQNAAVKKQMAGNTILLINGNQSDYSKDLAFLLSKKGSKVLRIPLVFEKNKESYPGLLQYLEGQTDWPQINFADEHYVISSGGLCRYANELLGSQAFKKLLDKLQEEYDWIILTTQAQLDSAEAQNILQYAHSAVITIKDQTWNQILVSAKRAKEDFIFIIVEK